MSSNPMRLLMLLSLAFFSVAGLGGCRGGTKVGEGLKTEANGRPNVVVTTSIIADSARRIAGDRMNVVALIGEGVDPHLFKPTRADVARMMEADLILYNGLMLEGRMGDILDRLSKERPVFAVAEQVDESLLLSAGAGEKTFDPHLWMDVGAWRAVVSRIAEVLIDFDPEGEAHYRENLETYQNDLLALESYLYEILGTLPKDAAILVTAHDAFQYFGRAYGVEVVGIQGLSTDSEAGLDDLNRLVDLLVKRQIRSVFVETSVADKNVRALLEGAAARGFKVEIGGELFSDSLGAAGTYEGTYLGMIDHNGTTIVRALGGTAPAGGFQGLLSSSEEQL